jgi:hypothetical protein
LVYPEGVSKFINGIEINKRIFPIMAGQIGVACCERKNPNNFKCKELESNLVLSLPVEANPETRNTELFFNNLKEKINNTPRVQKIGLKFSNILSPRGIPIRNLSVCRF